MTVSKSRPLSAEAFRAMFKIDSAKHAAKLDADKDLDDSKVGRRRSDC